MNDGTAVEIEPFYWEIYRSFINEGQLASEVIGTFTQYPLMLAWAVTIHKSQGKTFDNVIIDIGNWHLCPRADLRGVKPLHIAGRHRADKTAAEETHLDGFQSD